MTEHRPELTLIETETAAAVEASELTSLPDDATPEQREQHRHRLAMARLADQARHDRRQQQWNAIRDWAKVRGFVTHKQYDLLDPGGGVLIEVSLIGPHDAECRIYRCEPSGRRAKHRATIRFDGEGGIEPILSALNQHVVAIRESNSRDRRSR